MEVQPTYLFWQHARSHGIYAVRLECGGLTGICGPLRWTQVRKENLKAFHYDDQRDDVAWVQEFEPEGWRIFEPELVSG